MASALGTKINELRRAKGLTLEQLAEATGSSKSYMWEIENKDVARPSAEKLDQIAANMTLVTKANHMDKVDIGVLASDKSAVYAVKGNSHDIYDPTNHNLRVGVSDQELKPTMQAFRQAEQVAQPQQQQAVAPQQQQIAQSDPQPSHAAPVLNRYG